MAHHLKMFLFFEFTLLFHAVLCASITQHRSGSNSKLDCLKYQTDHDILSSLPFQIDLNPYSQKLSHKTYGLMDKDDHLYYLNIANEQTFSSIIFCFKHLKELYIRKTNFPDGRIPREIERLAPTLINLGIFDTIINILPEQIGKLKNLRTLELVRTYLRILPESIGDLTNLIYICLSYNSLEILPRPIINIVSLRQIDLSNNPFLHSIEQLNDHPFLRVIQANNCSIEKLPINLPKLTDLYMANNKLNNLVNIRTLGSKSDTKVYFYFDGNQITSIPPQIQYVHNLYSLNLNSNELKQLPSDIFMIKTLRYLLISDNRFNSNELKRIVNQFNSTNSIVELFYKPQRISTI